jgi:hypothetical protein
VIRELGLGVVAGALGTLALDVTTYADVAVRGRPTSDVPSKTVAKLAEEAGIDALAESNTDETAANRRSGVGALLGYGTGLAAGAAYGLARGRGRSLPLPLAGLAAGAAVMAATDFSSVRLGVTDPTTWGVSGWVSDIVPHAVYGLTTAAAFDWLLARTTSAR